nr:3-dehydroquinate synthase [Desulfobacterales bacterium]
MDCIHVSLKKHIDDSYRILIGKGILQQLSGEIEGLGSFNSQIIITDSNVNSLYGQRVLDELESSDANLHLLEIPPGEASKSLNTVIRLAKQLVSLHVDRKSIIIALGGGVVGDLAGFVASIYMRGIPYVQVPTTLLSQVDSSVGGKTGINLEEGKNLLGSFYQPKAVIIELTFLRTLSERDFQNGLAEIIKYGIISDEELFSLLEKESEAIKNRDLGLIEFLVERSCEIKSEVVKKDEKELGLRRILNFGHTLGHALESISDFRFSHGEAISIGMVAAAKISSKLGYLDDVSCNRIEMAIKRYGLPHCIPADLDTERIFTLIKNDKKALKGRPNFVLVRDIGNPFVTDEVPGKIVEETINGMKVASPFG